MLKGKLVKLREYREEDIKIAQDYINDPDTIRSLAIAVPFPFTYADEKKFVEGNSAFNSEYNFAIETLENPRYIGGCGIKNLDWKNSKLEIGIAIGDKKLRGKGYGTDAMKVLVDFIFNEMNINKIKLEVFTFNQGAIRCYEKAGFREEAILKNEVYRGGKFHDVVVMSIFRADYFRTDINRAIMV